MTKIGDKVYVVYNDTRNKPTEATVVKIGRKYLYTNQGPWENKFDIVTHESADNYDGWNPNSKFYLSEQEYLNEKSIHEVAKSLIGYIKNNIHVLSIEQLKAIKSMINNK